MILKLEAVGRKREGKQVLRNLSFCIPDGEFFVLMGPTGCGKTTTLRIAGLLDRPDEGAVYFRGRKADLPMRRLLPMRRRMVTVFQNPVMFSGTVRSNLEWGLRVRGMSRETVSRKIGWIMELTGLEGFGERDAGSLSGGETKLVALARAMVLEPELLILDEPTTFLHRSFREDLIEKIKELHRITGSTFLMATHDFSDALSVGTAGAVMRNGTIEQSGSIESILFSPCSTFMAEFTGTGNILPAEFHGNTAKCGRLIIRHAGHRNGHGCIAIPPEVIVLSTVPGVTSERNRFGGTVKGIARKGENWTVTAEVSGTLLDSAVTTGALEELGLAEGSEVFLSFKASAVHPF